MENHPGDKDALDGWLCLNQIFTSISILLDISSHIHPSAKSSLVSENYHTSWWQIFVVIPNIYLAHEHTFTLPSRAAASLHDQTSHDVCVFSTHLLPSKRTHRRSHLEAMQSNQFRFNLAPSSLSVQMHFLSTGLNFASVSLHEASWLYWAILAKCTNCPQCKAPKNLKTHTS